MGRINTKTRRSRKNKDIDDRNNGIVRGVSRLELSFVVVDIFLC